MKLKYARANKQKNISDEDLKKSETNVYTTSNENILMLEDNMNENCD